MVDRMHQRTARIIGLCLSILVGLAPVSAMPGDTEAQDIRFLRIGTGSTAGTYFPIGGLIANAISNPPGSRPCEAGGSCGVPGVIAAAVSTQGSVENVRAVVEGRLDFALSQADVAFFAFEGAGPFSGEEPLQSLRGIASLYPEAVHVVTRMDADITSIADLAGRRVAVGERASGTRVVAGIVLSAFGLTENDVTASYERLGAASDRLIEGSIDAFFIVGGYPLGAVTHVAEEMGVSLLPLGGAEAERLRESYPFLFRDHIPANVYPGVSRTETLSVGAQLVTSEALDAQLVYEITRALWHPNNRRVLDSGHPNGTRIRVQSALRGIAIPLHSGAARFYEEAGVAQASDFDPSDSPVSHPETATSP